jgi:hypothetical protein
MFDLNFPIVNNVSAKSIADDIQPMKSMTIEEAAKGRPIRPYPKRFDDFEDIATLLEYLEIMMAELDYPLDWLEVNEVSSMPINYSKDVYYTSVNCIAVTAYEPNSNPFHDIMRGQTILELNLENWEIESLRKRINKLKSK